MAHKLSIVSCLFAATLVASPVAAETTLRAFMPVNETRPEAAMFQNAFEDEIAELSAGDLELQTFFAGGLGFEVRDLLRHLKRGTVDIGLIVGLYYSRDAEPLSLMLVDGGITDPETLGNYREIFAEQFDKSLESWDIVNVGLVQPLVLDHSIFCKEPVASLDQLRSKKLRVWTKHQLEAFKSLGVAAQMIPQEELYIALQTGVVDCAIYLGEFATLVGLQEVAPYETYYLPYIAAPSGIGVSANAWNALTEEQRGWLREAGRNFSETASEEAMAAFRNRDAARLERAEKGITITEGFSEADRETLIDAYRATWREMADDAGPDARAMVEQILAVGN